MVVDGIDIGMSIVEVLLKPTRIYVRPVLAVLEKYRSSVHGMVHITGGGFYENIPRMYTDKTLISIIKRGSWKVPAIFNELEKRGADPSRMYNTFNMGIGFMMAVKASEADSIMQILKEKNVDCWKVGRVARAEKAAETQEDAVKFED